MIYAGYEIRTALLLNADKPVLHDLSGGLRTGQQLVDNIDRLAGALKERGFTGGRIGLWYRNSLCAVEAYLAAEWLGATRVPVDPNAATGEASAIFDAAGVDVILTGEERSGEFRQPTLFHADNSPLYGPPHWPAHEVPDSMTALLYPRSVSQGQLFAIPFSYGNWDAITRTNIRLYRSGCYGPWAGVEECFLAAQQIMHGTGLVGTYPFLRMGLPQVIVDQFDPERILEAIEHHKVTATMLVPVMLMRLAKAAGKRRQAPSTLRHVLYGGGPVTPEQLREALRDLGPVLVQVYGRMEGGWPISILGIDEHRAIMNGEDDLTTSCGKPIDDVEVQLRPQQAGGEHRGELWVRSPMNVAEFTDASGWCSLGDTMRRDHRGYLHFNGRNDRMINTGYHVYPAEIEAAIAETPGVSQVRVVGEANEDYGQTIVAYIVVNDTHTSDALVAGLRVSLKQRLAKYKVPHAFRIVEQLPQE